MENVMGICRQRKVEDGVKPIEKLLDHMRRAGFNGDFAEMNSCHYGSQGWQAMLTASVHRVCQLWLPTCFAVSGWPSKTRPSDR